MPAWSARLGQNLGSPFLVNQYTAYSQRDPASAVLTNGNVVVVWVSENQGLTPAELKRRPDDSRHLRPIVQPFRPAPGG